MKVIAAVQAKSSSSRGLLHYIAHSKVEAAKEPSQREIFNEYADNLDVEKANNFLTRGVSAKRPANDELHHLVISLKPEDFERLGKDESERQKGLKEITRHVMKQFANEIRADKLNWAAGIHRNTENPHVHIAIQKEYFDKNLEKKLLSKIPASLLPHYEKTPANKKILLNGLLIESATEKLNEILQAKEKLRDLSPQKSPAQMHQKQTSRQSEDNIQKNSISKSKIENERNILARAILAKYYLDKSQEIVSSLENYGVNRRFTIFDEISKKRRKMSLFDLERRAEKRAEQIVKKHNATDTKMGEELRKKLIAEELGKNKVGIQRIKTILHNLQRKENQNLRERENESKSVNPLAEKIRQNYRRQNKKLPTPNLKPDEIEMLQTEALEKKDFRVSAYFERMRLELAAERRTPSRTSKEISRLLAKQKINQLQIKLQEQQLKEFQERRRVIPIEENGQKKTLQEIESLIRQQRSDEQKLSGKVNKLFAKIGFIESKSNLKLLDETRAVINVKLGEKNDLLEKNLADEKSLQKTLDEFYKNDTNPDKESIEPKFSAAELAEIESLAFTLKLPDVYRDNWNQQKQMIETAGGQSQFDNDELKKDKVTLLTGRAFAREILAEVETARAKEDLTNFKKYQDFQKFEVKDEENGKSKFVSLSQVGLDYHGSILDLTLEYILESREIRRMRHTIEEKIKDKAIELKENIKAANSLLQIAREVAAEFKTGSVFAGTHPYQPPIFTPKELITIELRIIQTTDQTEAESLRKILNSADLSQTKNLSAILQSFENKKEKTKSSEQPSLDVEKSVIQVDKNQVKLSEAISPKQEQKIEIHNQDRGR